MKVILLCLALLSILSSTSFGQRSKGGSRKLNNVVPLCKLTEAPRLRNFYIGQSVDEIQKFVTSFREAYDFQKEDRNNSFPLSDWSREIQQPLARDMELVYVSSSSAFGFDSKRELLTAADYEDVQVIWWFFKERLFAYGIYYPELDIEQDAAKFIKQVSAKTTLPQKGWKSSDMFGELQCDGFKVDLNAGYRNFPHLIFTDLRTEAEIVRLAKQIEIQKRKDEQKRLRLEREKRSTFKP